jgi:hypothetical protein
MHIIWDYAEAIADLGSTTSSRCCIFCILCISRTRALPAIPELPKWALQLRYCVPRYSRRLANPKHRQPRQPAINMQAHPVMNSANHWEHMVDSLTRNIVNNRFFWDSRTSNDVQPCSTKPLPTSHFSPLFPSFLQLFLPHHRSPLPLLAT